MNHVYSDSLAELSYLTKPIMSDVAPLFQRALAELSLSVPTQLDAAWLLARHCAERIASEVERPFDALFQLARAVRAAEEAKHVLPQSKYVGDGVDASGLMSLYYAYSDAHDHYYQPGDNRVLQEHYNRLDGFARIEAREWLARHLPPDASGRVGGSVVGH